MDVSDQGWRKKWFYIKDQKTASSDHFGIAPFDANKSPTKLTSWDSPPTETEVENIKPLLTCIQSLKSATGGGLIGTQLMAFFLQRRIQLFKLVSPNYGLTLVRMIPLECPNRTQRKRISTNELDL
jgi:hypothetical protein